MSSARIHKILEREHQNLPMDVREMAERVKKSLVRACHHMLLTGAHFPTACVLRRSARSRRRRGARSGLSRWPRRSPRGEASPPGSLSSPGNFRPRSRRRSRRRPRPSRRSSRSRRSRSATSLWTSLTCPLTTAPGCVSWGSAPGSARMTRQEDALSRECPAHHRPKSPLIPSKLAGV